MIRHMRRISLSWRFPGIVVVLAAVIGFAGAGSSAFAYKSVQAEQSVATVSPEEEAAQMAALHGWLMREIPAGAMSAPVSVRLTEQERKDLQKRQEDQSGPAVVGRTKPLTLNVRFSELDRALLSDSPRHAGNGILRATPDGGFVWAVAVRSEEAGGIRVHINGMNLAPEADLFFFNESGQAFSYARRGPNNDGDFWTNTVFGSTGVVLIRHYGPDGAAALRETSLQIADVGHVGPKFTSGLQAVTESFCSFNVPCIINASCNTTASQAIPMKTSVALMQWVAGAFIYTCTGSLIADSDSGTQIPYFMTANHCINKAGNASSLEAYFQFSIACGSTNCPAQTQPGGIQRLGSTIKATGTGGDFTLLQLSQTPPGGSTFLGWNNAPIANTNNAALYRISHPAWAPQAYSAGAVSTSAPTCTGWPRGERIYSRTTTGGTEGGSSGSPVVNASSQFVGQLSGACGTNVNDACDQVNNATVDGAFAFYYSSVAPFLATTCTPTAEVCNDGVDNDCDGATDCADSNCAGSPSCPSCSPAGTSCTANSQCCSNKCKGPAGRQTCR
jgi:hypothetical protein